MIANHFAAKQPFCSLHPPKDGPGAAGISMVTAQAPAGCWGGTGAARAPRAGQDPKGARGKVGLVPFPPGTSPASAPSQAQHQPRGAFGLGGGTGPCWWAPQQHCPGRG